MNYLFNQFSFDPDRFELRENGAEVAIEPQVVELLRLLIENRDRVVGKEEIREIVWQGRIVSDTALSARIKTLRRALGDDGRRQSVIRTFHKRGFRFVSEVVTSDWDATLPAELGPTNHGKAQHAVPGIAVLPFTDLSKHREGAHLAGGITEEVILALAAIRDLGLASRKSAQEFQDGRRDHLDVDYLVEGSVRESGGSLRVTVHLTEMQTDTIVWAERFDGDLSDLFSLQEQLATQVAIAIQGRLGFDAALAGFQHGTGNHRAWRLCVEGIERYNRQSRQDNAEARRLLEEAVRLDPGYVGALSMLGWANYSAIRHGLLDDPAEADRKLRHVLEALQAIPSGRGEAHLLEAGLRLLEFDYAAAIEATRLAILAKPDEPNNHAYLGQIYSCCGRAAEALPCLTYALQLSPHYPTWMSIPLIDVHWRLGDLETAIGYARTAAIRAPNALQYQVRLAVLSRMSGRMRDTEDAMRRIRALAPAFSVQHFRTTQKHMDDTLAETIAAGLVELGVPIG